MASQNDVNNARQEGYEQGQRETIRRLRAFTGVGHLTPDLDLPEHRAYTDYLDQLTNAHQVAADRAENAREEISRLADMLAAAETEERHVLDQRREDRAGKNPFAQLGSRVGDFTLPISTSIRKLRRQLADQETQRTTCLDNAERYAAEATKVAQWLEECTADMDAVREDRERRAEEERLDAERARRDITPRWCQVFRHEDFTAADENRCGFTTFNDGLRDVGGADFGFRWQRDTPHGGVEYWALHHILETNETILEQHPQTADSQIWLLGDTITSLDEAMDLFDDIEPRQNERNSLALVLDTYAQHRATKTTVRAR